MRMNIQRGAQLAEEGIARSDSNASFVRKAAAAAAIEALAKRKLYFASEDVWLEMQANGVYVQGKHGSFLGAALRKAAKAGLIVLANGITLPSARPSNHLRIMRVWKSLLISAEEQCCPVCNSSNHVRLQRRIEKLEKDLRDADDLTAKWVKYSNRQQCRIEILQQKLNAIEGWLARLDSHQ